MFTGVVNAIAKVVEVRQGRLGIDHGGIAKHLKVGRSIEVNGVALTVVKKKGPIFYADIVPETLRRTNLGALKVGNAVNLELPITAAATLDGHLVQGHVDTTATVRSIDPNEFTIELPAALARLVAYRGSVAVDGISTTVVAVDKPPGTFKVAVIPRTP